jgi:glycerate dehydrogenase
MKTVILNGKKMNFDHALDYLSLDDEVIVYDDTTTSEILERIQDCDIVVTKELPYPSEIMMQTPDRVKLIVEAGTGYNNISLEAASKKKITVCNIPAYSTQRVAHTAIMLLLNLSSSMQKQIRMLERGDHRNFEDHLIVPHVEVNDKILGVVGEGHIGQEVIKVALALGMKVLVSTRHPKNNPNVTYVSRDELLEKADYISLHCALTSDTFHLIDEKAISKMKKTAFIINTSRGALIDEKALILALKDHRIAGAGLDVLEHEPPLEDSPLYDMEDVIITPHMGWKGKETRERLLSIIKEDIDAFKAGHPVNVVNKMY